MLSTVVTLSEHFLGLPVRRHVSPLHHFLVFFAFPHTTIQKQPPQQQQQQPLSPFSSTDAKSRVLGLDSRARSRSIHGLGVILGLFLGMYIASTRKSFKDSLKVLEADIQHANTLASDFSREYDGACLQMRMSYSPAAHIFLFLVQWTDCHLAGALGLLRILIYKVYVDGTTTMSTHERKASIREFYGMIYPSLQQLQGGVTDTDDRNQKAVYMERYRRRDGEERCQYSNSDAEREEECGICMELNSKIVLPNCNHVMCLKCYREWRGRSQSCPFCRDSLRRVNSGDLWVYTDCKDIVDMATVMRENLRRLFLYVDKLPLIVPDSLLDKYDSHVR